MILEGTGEGAHVLAKYLPPQCRSLVLWIKQSQLSTDKLVPETHWHLKMLHKVDILELSISLPLSLSNCDTFLFVYLFGFSVVLRQGFAV